MAILKQLDVFHDFLEAVMGLPPLVSSEVFLFPLYSATLLVLCRLNVREGVGCCQVGEAKGKRCGQLEENFKNSCDYCHLQTRLFFF